MKQNQTCGRSTGFCLALLVAVFADGGPLVAQTTKPVDFARDILPVLADHCFTCHGPDAGTREGGFRLDVREGPFGEADSGEIPVVPGEAAASELVRRLLSDDPGEVMPPADVEKRPTPQQIRLIRRWIDEGARWQEHWAFVPPSRPDLPQVKNKSWPRNPIDHFVLAKLESNHLSPAAEADPRTLVRRVYLDLTGLPPEPDEVDAFVRDPTADAWEKLVDRLLDSPRYGEHMATFWLDAARFADTNGYQNDFRRSMWLWRDWVIRAYNDNMPFDQFAIEQIAGDMLPDATLDQKIATGFNRNHRTVTEGGSIEEEWLVENVIDRVETTATVFLGLTMGCARCHDHKYDPVSQREFYQFFDFFYHVDEQGVNNERRGNVAPLVQVVTDDYRQRLDGIQEQIAAADAKLDQLDRELAGKQPSWEQALLESDPVPDDGAVWALLNRSGEARPAAVAQRVGEAARTHTLDEGLPGPVIRFPSGPPSGPSSDSKKRAYLDLGDTFDFDATRAFTVSGWVRPTVYGAILSRMDESNAYRGFDMLIMPDGRLNVHLIHRWPQNGTKITTTPAIPVDRWTHVVVRCQPPGKAANIDVYLNGQRVPHAVNSDTLDGSTLTDFPVRVGWRARTPPFQGEISGLRIRESVLSGEGIQAEYRETLKHMVAATRANRTAAREAEIKSHFLANQRSYRMARQAREKGRAELKQIRAELPTTMVMAERSQPRQTFVLQRGEYDKPDRSQPVSAGVPALFRSTSSPGNRLELARWLVEQDNPLTARVAVNHFWMRYFGIGLLETPENFGVQSPPPSHPELLDWLATEFVRSGWDVKAMQKRIVCSATYRQSSAVSRDRYLQDPDNRLLGRGPRFRLPAESIRDSALAISGLLSEKIGGPSVMPYQPAGLWEELAGGAGEPAYVQATNEDLYRRSLYIYRKRTVPHPTMTTFDGTGREICTVARSRTNTPLQALALLNDATYVEAARGLASLALAQADDPAGRITWAFRRATAREPEPRELEVLNRALEKYQQAFAAAPGEAKKYLGVGQSEPDAGYPPEELAAYAMLCSVLLNLDEVITRE